MSNFGSRTDHWDLSAAGEFVMVGGGEKIPVAQSRADAADENGDIADAAWHGNTSAGLFTASVVYALIGGTGIPAAALKIGQLAVGKVATSFEISTSNGEWPQITISGILGSTALEQVKTYAIPDPGALPKKQAQLCNAVVLTTGKLTSCSLSATCNWAQQDNGLGEPVAYGVDGAMLSATATATGLAAAVPVLAPAVGWDISQNTGVTEAQAAWDTASITVEKIPVVAIAP